MSISSTCTSIVLYSLKSGDVLAIFLLLNSMLAWLVRNPLSLQFISFEGLDISSSSSFATILLLDAVALMVSLQMSLELFWLEVVVVVGFAIDLVVVFSSVLLLFDDVFLSEGGECGGEGVLFVLIISS